MREPTDRVLQWGLLGSGLLFVALGARFVMQSIALGQAQAWIPKGNTATGPIALVAIGIYLVVGSVLAVTAVRNLHRPGGD